MTTGRKEAGEIRRLLVVWPQYREYNKLFFRLLHEDKRLELRVIWIRNFNHGEKPIEQLSNQMNYEIVGAKNIRLFDYDLKKFLLMCRVIWKKTQWCDFVLTSTQNPLHSKIAYLFSKILRKPLFVVVETWRQPKHNGILYRLYQRIGDCLLHNSKMIFVHGSVQKQYLLQKGVKPSNIKHLPFLSADLSKVASDAKTIRAKYKLLDRVVILYLGRIIPRKGLEELILAFRKIKEEVPDVFLLIAGSADGPEKAEGIKYEQRCKTLANDIAPNEILFTGTIKPDDSHLFFAAADLFVHPHNTYQDQDEGWGLVLNEAASMGLPIIATDRVGSAYDLIKTGVNGFIVKSGSVEELSEKIRELLLDKKKLHSFSINSRMIFETFHQEHLIVDRILEAMEDSSVH